MLLKASLRLIVFWDAQYKKRWRCVFFSAGMANVKVRADKDQVAFKIADNVSPKFVCVPFSLLSRLTDLTAAPNKKLPTSFIAFAVDGQKRRALQWLEQSIYCGCWYLLRHVAKASLIYALCLWIWYCFAARLSVWPASVSINFIEHTIGLHCCALWPFLFLLLWSLLNSLNPAFAVGNYNHQ